VSLNPGRRIRYDRLVRPETGHTIMVPLDHGMIYGPMRGIEDPVAMVRSVVAGGVDGVIFNTGLARPLLNAVAGRCGTVHKLTNSASNDDYQILLGGVEHALRLGADWVSVEVHIGSPLEEAQITNARIVAEGSELWNVPLLIMVYADPAFSEEKGPLEALRHVTRSAAELGADIVKTSYPDDVDAFQRVVEGCPVPVVIAGGVRDGDEIGVLQLARDAVDVGAIGLTLGRSVWGASDPERLARALVRVVHDGASVADAQDVLQMREPVPV
jgi:DhnA family fructose-bisphosphate aldolase class Ia